MNPNQNPQSPQNPQGPIPSPEIPVAPYPPQPAQPSAFGAPSIDPHFPADHPVPDGSKPVRNDPGKTLGLVSFFGIFVGFGLISVILGFIAYKRSKQSGYRNGFAIAGIILGILEAIAGIIIGIFLLNLLFGAVDVCQELGSGTHVLVDGTSVNCNL